MEVNIIYGESQQKTLEPQNWTGNFEQDYNLVVIKLFENMGQSIYVVSKNIEEYMESQGLKWGFQEVVNPTSHLAQEGEEILPWKFPVILQR